MKTLLLFLLLALSPAMALAQTGTKFTEYPADTSPTADDLILITNDPAGTPASRKVTIGDLGTALETMISLTESQTLNDVVSLGATATGRNSCANAFKIEGDTAGNGIALLDDGANGPELVPYIAGVCNDANRGLRLNPGKSVVFKDSTGAEIFSQAEATGAVTFPTAAKQPTRAIYLPARYAEVDGTPTTGCTLARVQQNGGPFKGVMRCGDSATGRFDLTFNTKGFKYNGGTVVLSVHSFHGTSESITWGSDISMQCRSAGDVINSTYSTPVNLDIAITSAEVNELQTTNLAAHTPNGTCAADDEINILGTVDATAMSTNGANTQIIGWTLTFSVTGL